MDVAPPPSDPPEAVVAVRGLGRRFGPRWALRDLGFRVVAGEVLGLVGPNGSGKSTLLRILAGFLRSSEGEAHVLGFDPFAERRRVMERARFAFAPPALFESLTAREHLLGLAAIGRTGQATVAAREVSAVLERVGLDTRADEPVRVFSFGMRQRLALAQALLPAPKLLVLDEPTDGLDPVAVVELRELLRDLAHQDGVAILVAGHLMSEMAALADRILVLVDGRELFQGRPEELSAGSERLVLRVDRVQAARVILEGRSLTPSIEGQELALPVGAIGLGDAQALLRQHGIVLEEYRVARASLDTALVARLRAASALERGNR